MVETRSCYLRGAGSLPAIPAKGVMRNWCSRVPVKYLSYDQLSSILSAPTKIYYRVRSVVGWSRRLWEPTYAGSIPVTLTKTFALFDRYPL